MIVKKEDDVVYYDSSNILFSTYDKVKKILYICFKNGQTYTYGDIDEQVNNLFESAESQGKYLAANIKGKFQYIKDQKISDFETEGVKSFISRVIKEQSKSKTVVKK